MFRLTNDKESFWSGSRALTQIKQTAHSKQTCSEQALHKSEWITCVNKLSQQVRSSPGGDWLSPCVKQQRHVATSSSVKPTF